MKGFKLRLAGFVIASLIASFIVSFLTALVVLSVGGLLPVLFYALSMAVVGYAFFEVFRTEEEARYIYSAVISTLFLALPPVVMEKASSVLSSLVSALGAQSFSLNADYLLVSTFACFNLVLILFYARKNGFKQYNRLLAYLLPLAAYTVLMII
jgi:hypothetical protein